MSTSEIESESRGGEKRRSSPENPPPPEDAGSSPKRPKLDEEGSASGSDDDEEETEEEGGRDPGKSSYSEMRKLLRRINDLIKKPDRDDEETKEMYGFVNDLKLLCCRSVDTGEVPNPLKLVQIQLKHMLLHSEKIKDEDNVKNFVTGLEDSSASRSDQDDGVFVFLANLATELWYKWVDEQEEEEGESGGYWKWTPDWDFWMPCSSTVVSGGQWKGETPAPENVEIIHYLDAIKPMPSDETYLPVCDVMKVFEQLRVMEDAGTTEALRVVVDKLATAEVKSENEHVKKFKEALVELGRQLAAAES